MMKILKDFKSYYNYLLVLIGLGIVSWIIWARFLRARVPKDIPFHLTEHWLYILVYICIIYFYVAYKLIRPGKPNDTLKIIADLLFTPLVTLDEYIKDHPNIKPTYLKLVGKVIIFIQSNDEVWGHYALIKRIYIIFYILPRTILVSVLCLDTFYFHKLAWIYKVILLGTLPLLHRYLKYSIKYIREQYIKKLEYNYKYVKISDKTEFIQYTTTDDPKFLPLHDTNVSIREYIEIELNMQEIGDSTIGYRACPFNQNYIVLQYLQNKYNSEDPKYLTEEDFDYLDKDFKKWIPIILDLSIFLENYGDVDDLFLISKSMRILIKHAKIIIFSLYGICWAYIIYRSYHMIPYPFLDTLCELVITLPGLEEPFSGELIIYL